MRHEVPGPQAAANRLPVSDPSMYIFKVLHGSIGRLALARVLGGSIKEGSDLKADGGEHARLGALFTVQGEKTAKISEARDGDVVAVAKIDEIKAGEWLSAGKLPPVIDIGYPARN